MTPGTRNLLLYTTAGCHLCEQAGDLVRQVLAEGCAEQIRVEAVDIADDPELMERYGIRIPVIRMQGSEEELGWPFDEAAVRRLIGA